MSRSLGSELNRRSTFQRGGRRLRDQRHHDATLTVGDAAPTTTELALTTETTVTETTVDDTTTEGIGAPPNVPDVPGFGVLSAFVAVLAVGLLSRSREQH